MLANCPGADPGFQERGGGGANKGEGLHNSLYSIYEITNAGWKDKYLDRGN